MRGRERTGARGDYFTSADLHPVFARLTARQVEEMWQHLGRPGRFSLVEVGAGRGWFAVDFLAWTRRAFPDFAAALDYVAIEPSPATLERLRWCLSDAGIAERVRLLSSLEALDPIEGCFFSNEFLDALPVAVVTRAAGRLKEIYVEARGEDLVEALGPLSDPSIAAAVAPFAERVEEGQRVEVCRAVKRFAKTLGEKLRRGFVITVDYGDLAENLYTPDRPRGTLLAYRRHRPSEEFYADPGEQDLTAHVNFTAVIEEGRRAGLSLTGFTTQERWLLALGETNQFNDLYDVGATEKEKLVARLKLKRLLNPEGMGSVYRVLVQHRDIAPPRLTGLRYARSQPLLGG